MGKKQPVKHDKEKISFVGRIGGKPLIIFFLASAAILTFIAYLRSLNGPLVLDDALYIKPSELDDIWRNLKLKIRSVSVFSFSLNYNISGMNLAGFRITNIILHILSAGLAFYLTYITLTLPSIKERYKTLNDREIPLYAALFVAVLFALHPIQTSAVNYITQRMAIMASMFSFAGLILYIRGSLNTGKKSILFYLFSSVSFILAIFSKENAVMAIIMLPVYDFIFLSSLQWKEFKKRFIPLCVIFGASALLAASAMNVMPFLSQIIKLVLNPNMPMEWYGWSGRDIDWTPIEYFLTELRIVSRYIFIILVPLPSLMVFDYSSAFPVSKGLFDPLTTLFSLLFLLSAMFFSLRYIKKAPLISFGILWYLVTISLESFVALGLDPYFEHRNYLPAFGLFFASASLLINVDKIRVGLRKEAIIAFAAILLFALTFVRNGVWADDEILWKDTLEKSPNNTRAMIALSSINIMEKRFHEAGEYLKRAQAASPSPIIMPNILFNQASIYRQTNRRQESLDILKQLDEEKAFPKGETRSLVSYLIGEILCEQGDFIQARKYFKKAYRWMPQIADNIINLGLASRSRGELDAAEGYFKNAVAIAPEKIIPYVQLGEIYLAKNAIYKAEEKYQEAIAKKPADADIQRRALFGMAQIKLIKGDAGEAKKLFQEVIKITPAFYPPYIFLGRILLEENEPKQALYHLEKALSFKASFKKNEPNTKLLYFYLANAYLAIGDNKLARENLSIFISLYEGDKRLEKQYERAKKALAKIKE